MKQQRSKLKTQMSITPASAKCRPSQREALVFENLAIVSRAVETIRRSIPAHVEPEDLMQAGVVGLIDAADKYDGSRQVKFPTFAEHRVRGAILDHLRNQDWASRELRRQQKQATAAIDDLKRSLCRTPTDDEVAERLGITVGKWRELRLKFVGLLPDLREQTEPRLDESLLADTGNHPDSLFMRAQGRKLLAAALRELSPRHRLVIKLFYIAEMPLNEIGGRLGVSDSRISQIRGEGLRQMGAALQSAGVHRLADVCE